MNQLQTTFHLPDFIIMEISRHVHQLHLTEVNQEYHQIWKPRIYEYSDGSNIFVGLVSKVIPSINDGFHIRIWVNDGRMFRYSTIHHFQLNGNQAGEFRSVASLPKNYVYTSGCHLQNRYSLTKN